MAEAVHHSLFKNLRGDTLRDRLETIEQTRMIRSRYTILDLVHDVAIFDQIVDQLFSEQGF